MASSTNEETWKPRWSFKGEPYAAVVFTSQPPARPAHELYDEATSLLVANFLSSRLKTSTELDLQSDASFLYVLLERAPAHGAECLEIEERSAFVEFGFGMAPAAPEEWETIPLRELIGRAIHWLKNGAST
jgi:hypothetical protein